MNAITADTGNVDSGDKNQQSDFLTALHRRIRRFTRRVARYTGVVTLDALALYAAMSAAAGCVASAGAQEIIRNPLFLALFGVMSLTMFAMAGLYRRSWRFLSFGDCVFLAATVSISLVIAWGLCAPFIDHYWKYRFALLPVAVVHWSLLMVVMCAMRVMRRGLREYGRHKVTVIEPAQRRKALLLGELDWARAMVDLARVDNHSDLDIIGVMTPDDEAHSLQVGGVPNLGAFDMLTEVVETLTRRGRRPSCIIMRDQGEGMQRQDFMRLVKLADRLNLTIARAHDPWTQMAQGSPRLNLEVLPLADLLGRPEVQLERDSISRLITGRRVLVTGAGGTIGGELVRQLATFDPAEIVLLDHGEYALYAIDMEVREAFPNIAFHVALCSIRQRTAVRAVFAEHQPEIVFHAAALKHVPLVEANPCAGVHTNVVGTRNVADAACEFGARAMVQVSTDKAVNPVGMMGATKRLGELYCQALDIAGEGKPDAPRFMTVRFGNVLGSSGSLVPLFKRQLAEGRALTVTHPEIERYFMTVQEAVQLILQSSARAMEDGGERGSIFVLDMGDPVKIVDIARRMIRLAGLEPDRDVPITFVGLRPGEKLFEELFDSCETRIPSAVPGVFEARPVAMPLPAIVKAIAELEQLVLAGDRAAVCDFAHQLIKVPVIEAKARADASVVIADAAMAAMANDTRTIIPAHVA